MEPIGHLKSLFKFKNGTPRQAGVCSTARGILTISKSIFNNPEHSLEGLEEFSHAWIIFLFHKNNNACVKAKVRPPRLNGKRIGVFATRAPYRPNPIGLTLAKIEKISGADIHFSGIDLLDGTPVLDVKPFIRQYDDPIHNSASFQTNSYIENSSCDDPATSVVKTNQVFPFSKAKTKLNEQLKIDQVSISSSQLETDVDHLPETDQLKKTDQMSPFSKVGQNEDQPLQTDEPTFPQTNTGLKRTYSAKLAFKDSNIDDTCPVAKHSFQPDVSVSKSEDSGPSKLPECHTDKFSVTEDPMQLETDKSATVSAQFNKNSESCDLVSGNSVNQASSGQVTTTASWVMQAPVSKLTVIFNARAKQQLLKFSLDSNDPAYRLQFLQNKDEVYQAISDILAEDPRSIYRRNACKDSLYHFAVDSVHVTCWFFDQFAEILFIQPASDIPQTRTP